MKGKLFAIALAGLTIGLLGSCQKDNGDDYLQQNVLPDGALTGVFTVGPGNDDEEGTDDDLKVCFSRGNLTATVDAKGTPISWKFAANQYDFLREGGANKTIGTAAGDVDLFGWSASTSGTATTDNYGITTSTTASDYSGEFYDWGKAVGDGSTWRTLSKEEWKYLFETRKVNGGTGSDHSYSRSISYGGKNGVVLYPDNYTGPVLSYRVETLPEGVVFLPVAGKRLGSDIGGGGYWSSTADSEDKAYAYDSYIYRYFGCSVRLVTDVK